MSCRKETVYKGSLRDLGTNQEGIVGYIVSCYYDAPTLEDRLGIANKVIKLMMEYEGKLVVHDVTNNKANVSCEFLFEEAADYFMKNLKLELEEENN